MKRTELTILEKLFPGDFGFLYSMKKQRTIVKPCSFPVSASTREKEIQPSNTSPQMMFYILKVAKAHVPA
jgi:hypothetical protein